MSCFGSQVLETSQIGWSELPLWSVGGWKCEPTHFQTPSRKKKQLSKLVVGRRVFPFWDWHLFHRRTYFVRFFCGKFVSLQSQVTKKKSAILGGLLRIGFFNTHKKSLKKSKRRRLWTPRRMWMCGHCEPFPGCFFFAPPGWLIMFHIYAFSSDLSFWIPEKNTIEAPGFTGKNRATSEEAIRGRRFFLALQISIYLCRPFALRVITFWVEKEVN